MVKAAVLLTVLLGQAPGVAPNVERWANPWLWVRPDGVGLFSPFDLSSRPRFIPVSDLKERLRELPANAWPKGRVVAVQEVAFLPADEARLTANVTATLAILSDLGLDIDRRPRAAPAIEYAEVIESEGGTGAVKLHLLEEALAITDQVIAATPTSQRALVYRVRLLHLTAELTISPEQRAKFRAEANRAWRDTVAVRLAPKTPAPATSSDLSAAIFGERFADTVRRLHAIDTSRFWPPPARRWEVAPVYTQRPITVPIVEIIIGPEGAVANARVVRGEPAVARSVLEAARLQFYTPPMVQGHASAWIQLVTFPVDK